MGLNKASKHIEMFFKKIIQFTDKNRKAPPSVIFSEWPLVQIEI